MQIEKLRDPINLKAGCCIKEQKLISLKFKEILELFKSNAPKHFNKIKKFFETPSTKLLLLKRVELKNHLTFQTIWEGSQALIKTIEKEQCERAKKADTQLLKQDLLELKKIVHIKG